MVRAGCPTPGAQLTLALLLLLLPSSAIATCEGGACADEHAAASAAGLRRSGRQSVLGACQPKKYPSSGSLMPITLDTQILDLVWVNSTAEGQAHIYAITQDRGGALGGPLWRTEDPGRADAWRDITPMLTGTSWGGSEGGLGGCSLQGQGGIVDDGAGCVGGSTPSSKTHRRASPGVHAWAALFQSRHRLCMSHPLLSTPRQTWFPARCLHTSAS